MILKWIRNKFTRRKLPLNIYEVNDAFIQLTKAGFKTKYIVNRDGRSYAVDDVLDVDADILSEVTIVVYRGDWPDSLMPAGQLPWRIDRLVAKTELGTYQIVQWDSSGDTVYRWSFAKYGELMRANRNFYRSFGNAVAACEEHLRESALQALADDGQEMFPEEYK